MNNGLSALHSGLDERFGDIVADDIMVNRIIHTCIKTRRDVARFPVRLVSLFVACAALVFFTAATLLLNGGVPFSLKQLQGASPPASEMPHGAGSAPASAFVGGEQGGNVAVSVLVPLTPALGENGLYGFTDKEGVFVIEPQYSEAEPFKGDRAAVVLDGRRVMIDINGNVIEE